MLNFLGKTLSAEAVLKIAVGKLHFRGERESALSANVRVAQNAGLLSILPSPEEPGIGLRVAELKCISSQITGPAAHEMSNFLRNTLSAGAVSRLPVEKLYFRRDRELVRRASGGALRMRLGVVNHHAKKYPADAPAGELKCISSQINRTYTGQSA